VDDLVGDLLGVRLGLGLGLADRISPREARCGERETVGEAGALGLRLGLAIALSLIDGVGWVGAGGSARTASSLAKMPLSPPVPTETPTSAATTSTAAAAMTR
jgi:hypothetical protein